MIEQLLSLSIFKNFLNINRLNVILQIHSVAVCTEIKVNV